MLALQASHVSPLAYMLARWQFGFTISFHILLAAFSIGLGSYLMVLEGLWLFTGRSVFIDVYNYWLKILAINFAAGSVTGVIMEYQVGTNWGVWSQKVGSVIGPLMLYEVMTAFFLEAGFLGIMLFGQKRVGRGLHFFATCAVALGSVVSAFFILAANSWMQTPAGFSIDRQGMFVPESWLHIVFNPSFPYRFVHMTLAAYLATAALVGAVGAWHLLHDRGNRGAALMFSMAFWMITVTAPMQIAAGDSQGDNTLRYQPAKVAAMEGDWDTGTPGAGEPMVLFAWPSMARQRDLDTVEIPHVASIYLRHDWNGAIDGLKTFGSNIPYVPLVFFAFRLMVGLGLLMLAAGIGSLVMRWRGRFYTARWFQYFAVAMAPSGFVAMLAGWVVTEAGRQPYTVYGLLRTDQSNSAIALPGMIMSLSLILTVYVVIYGAGLYMTVNILRRAPAEQEKGPRPSLGQDSAAQDKAMETA